ncbi:MAG TPA: universal stress protein [Flavobacteriales bacterium]|nr:universal stress protein [Flavobacteriales bacterium]
MLRILLPTDFSDRSLNAAACAVDLFGADGNQFTLLHVSMVAGMTDPMVPMDISAINNVNEQDLAHFEERLRAKRDLAGARIDRVISFGLLSVAVHEAARENRSDLIVMASAGDESPALFGSNTTSVIQGASTPVLEIPDHSGKLEFKKILFADDRSAVEESALRMLAVIVKRCNAQLVVAHIATGRAHSDQVDNSGLYKKMFGAANMKEVVVEDNDVEGALFSVSAEEQVDMIALLHRHTKLFTGLIKPSTTKRVALHSNIPVLALEQ